MPFDDVEVVTGDTRRFQYAVGTFASRAAVMSGNAVADAARKVKAKALQVAADALEANPDDLEIVDGIVSVKGTPTSAIPLTQVAVLGQPAPVLLQRGRPGSDPVRRQRRPRRTSGEPGDEPGLEATGWYSPVHATFASGAHAVELEVDPDTSRSRSSATASSTTAVG